MGGPVSLASESQARILNLSGEAGGSSRSVLGCSIQTLYALLTFVQFAHGSQSDILLETVIQ